MPAGSTLPDRAPGRPMDFLHRLTPFPAEQEFVLLPSPYAILLREGAGVRLVGPHDRVLTVRAGALMACAPNLIKAVAGHPWRFVDAVVSVREVPLLRPFEEHGATAWPALLDDLRAAVEVTRDEAQFVDLWQALTGDGALALPGVDQRQAERLCRRYAGQSPSRILRRLRLADQLAADIAAGEHRPLGGFADQSHYIREARNLTGRTPRHWRSLDASFRTADGAPVPSSGR